ncbi:MAG: hypothetical protein ACREEM_47265 [Blastocatellia bacterium]
MKEMRKFRLLRSGGAASQPRAWFVKLVAVGAFAVGLAMLMFVSTLGERDSTAAASRKYQINIPKGLPADLWQELIPKDNPMPAAKVALGENKPARNPLRSRLEVCSLDVLTA